MTRKLVVLIFSIRESTCINVFNFYSSIFVFTMIYWIFFKDTNFICRINFSPGQSPKKLLFKCLIHRLDNHYVWIYQEKELSLSLLGRPMKLLLLLSQGSFYSLNKIILLILYNIIVISLPLFDNINCSKVSSELGNARYFFDCKIRIYKIMR